MTKTIKSKALAAIEEDRVRVIRANDRGIALDVVASKPDPSTLERATYRSMLWIEDCSIKRGCTCPALKRCYHIETAAMLWRPAGGPAVTQTACSSQTRKREVESCQTSTRD